MRFGGWFGLPFGGAEQVLGLFEAELVNSGSSVRVRFAPQSGEGARWFGVYLNARLQTIVYVEEGATYGPIHLPAKGLDGSVLVLPHGRQTTGEMERVARTFDEPTSPKATLSWTWTPEVIGCFDAAGDVNPDLSAWSLTGLSPQALEQTETATRMQLKVGVVTDSGTTTVTLYRNGLDVASGSCTAPATCTLAEANDSGISGTVDVGATPTDAEDSVLRVRWPYSMQVLRDVTDPPTTVRATVLFDRQAAPFWTEPTALSANTYYYRLRPVSDTGDAGTATASFTAAIPGPPAAPSGLAYASGNAAATVLSFTPSATAGATYRLYLQAIGAAYLDVMNIAATALAGATTITLPAVTGYAGTVRVILRAVSGGVEEENCEVYKVEYDAAGARVAPRPNDPQIASVAVTAGTALSVVGAYDTTDEAGVATTLKLYVRTTSGSYDFASPDGTGTLAAAAHTSLKTATISYAGSNGWRYVTLKAATAAGVLSEGYAEERLVYFSDADAAAPSAALSIARG